MLMQKPEFTVAVFFALHPEYLDVFVTFSCDFGSFLSVVLMLMIFIQLIPAVISDLISTTSVSSGRDNYDYEIPPTEREHVS